MRPALDVDGDERQRDPQASRDVALRKTLEELWRQRCSEASGHALLVRESAERVKRLTGDVRVLSS